MLLASRKLCLLVMASSTADGVAFGTDFAVAQTRILETGSSLLYPLFNLWVPAY